MGLEYSHSQRDIDDFWLSTPGIVFVLEDAFSEELNQHFHNFLEEKLGTYFNKTWDWQVTDDNNYMIKICKEKERYATMVALHFK